MLGLVFKNKNFVIKFFRFLIIGRVSTVNFWYLGLRWLSLESPKGIFFIINLSNSLIWVIKNWLYKTKYGVIELTMTHLSFWDFCWLATQLYQKKEGHCVFVLKHHETADNTGFKYIKYKNS